MLLLKHSVRDRHIHGTRQQVAAPHQVSQVRELQGRLAANVRHINCGRLIPTRIDYQRGQSEVLKREKAHNATRDQTAGQVHGFFSGGKGVLVGP
jgi:hypothetical protein